MSLGAKVSLCRIFKAQGRTVPFLPLAGRAQRCGAPLGLGCPPSAQARAGLAGGWGHTGVLATSQDPVSGPGPGHRVWSSHFHRMTRLFVTLQGSGQKQVKARPSKTQTHPAPQNGSFGGNRGFTD